MVSIDLSKVIKLTDVVFHSRSSNVERITATLQTSTHAHRNLRQITTYVLSGFYPFSFDFIQIPVEEIRRQWQDLDHILVRLWESYSIRPRVAYAMVEGEGREWCTQMRDCTQSSLSEMGRGIIDPIEYWVSVGMVHIIQCICRWKCAKIHLLLGIPC